MNMKRILFIALPLFLLLSSCDTNLDQTPQNQASGSAVFKDVESASTLLTGTYKWFHKGLESHYLDLTMFATIDTMGDDIYVSQTGNYGRWLETYQYNVLISSNYSLDLWGGFYAIIDNANIIINNIESLPQSDERDRIQGEAYALRAYAYHFLVRLFAKPYNSFPQSPGVILRTESGNGPVVRSTVADAYMLIESDLIKAIDLLDVLSGNRSTIDKRAAQAILARVYLDMGADKRADAIIQAKNALAGLTLMDAKTYSTAKFSDFNSETIWAYEATADNNSGYLSIPSFYYYADGGSLNAAGKIEYKNVVNGYSSLRVSRSLIDIFDDSDIRKKFFPIVDGTSDYLTYTGGILTTKFRGRSGTLAEGAINYLRGSEMYLIIAEAEADNSNFTAAKTALNTLRNTRGLGDYTGSDSDLVSEIQNERRRELFGEGHRAFDLKRRNLPLNRTEALEGHWSYLEIPAGGDRFEYPIPEKEMNSNKALQDTDQNPYYRK